MSVVGSGWGQRGQSREGVEHPDCLVEETVLEPAGSGSETPQSPPRRQQVEEAVRWVGGVTCNPGGSAGVINVQKGGKRDTNDSLSCSHSALQEGAVPQGDAAGQDTFNGASGEGGHDGGLSLRRKYSR